MIYMAEKTEELPEADFLPVVPILRPEDPNFLGLYPKIETE